MSATPPPVAPHPSSAPGAHVLVADDDPLLLKTVARAIGEMGATVERARDGQEAADLLRTRHFDAIVSDISMPGMTGLQLLRVVREQDLDVPVVLMTGDPSVETAIQAIEYGALRYLPKPFDTKVLQRTVEHAIKLGRMARFKRQALELLGEGAWQLGDRASQEAAFERALATLWVAFQPIVRWSTRTVIAYEALLRSGEPTLANPMQIIDTAERLGRVYELGRSIRRRVAASLPQADPAADCFVNLHPIDLLDEELFSPDSPLTAWSRRVVLEITERSSLEKVRDVGARVARLRRLGFRIAVDDLGAGYAGLASFALLEPEAVKLDMFLVRGIDRDQTKKRLVRSMTELCREVGMLVICEGVETVEERDALVALGCDNLQGYLFARPARDFPPVAW